MADRPPHPIGAGILSHRCFYLFLALILLIVLLPTFDHSEVGQLWFSTANLLILVASLVSLGRSRFTFWVALLLVGPALVLLALSHATGDAGYRVWSWRFSILVLVATLVPLLRYVLGPEAMTIDKLFGGAAAYLLLGLLWCYLFRRATRGELSPAGGDRLTAGAPSLPLAIGI
jgi:hypothetical protein